MLIIYLCIYIGRVIVITSEEDGNKLKLEASVLAICNKNEYMARTSELINYFPYSSSSGNSSGGRTKGKDCSFLHHHKGTKPTVSAEQATPDSSHLLLLLTHECSHVHVIFSDGLLSCCCCTNKRLFHGESSLLCHISVNYVNACHIKSLLSRSPISIRCIRSKEAQSKSIPQRGSSKRGQ